MDVLPGTRGARATIEQRASPHRRSRWITLVLAAVAIAMAAFALGGSGHTAAPTTYTMFGDATPAVTSAPDDKSVTLGVRFDTSSSGWITAIRFYQGPENTGQHDGTLWSSTGQQLASASFNSTSGTGWQVAQFITPVQVESGSSYTASYTAPNGGYAADVEALSPSAPKVTSSLTAVQGVYSYDGGYPKLSSRNLNYYVDVVFTTTAPSDFDATAKPTTTTMSTTPETTSTSPIATSPPSNSAKPGPSNTGVPAGTVLTPYTGPHTITTADTVIDSKDITGSLDIQAKNVTIRNSKIHDDMSATAGINVQDTGSATITDSEIYNFQVGIVYSNWTAIRVNMHDITFDSIKMASNTQLRESWIHSPKPTADAHWDGVQVQSGVVNTVIQDNFIDATGGATNSALFLCPDLGPSTNGPLTVTGNWLDGGNYTVFILDGANKTYFISNISVTNNRFGHTAQYGATDINVPLTWSGNVWDDTGVSVNY
jgi:hypothetical protein